MPSTALRNKVITHARSIVAKMGTQLLIGSDGRIDQDYLDNVAGQVAGLIKKKIQVTLVSSGAIAVGRSVIGMDRRPADIGVAQAVAAVGQSGLMNLWHQAFSHHGIHVGQVLLTRGDFEDRNRYLNIRNCISELHRLGVVPIINENDTVAVDEIRFGENDILAGLLTNALSADVLVLLTSVDGLKDSEGEVLDIVHDPTDALALVLKERSALGSGGMQTKLEAARLVTDAGEVAVIAHGRESDILTRLVGGEKLGTVFVPANRRMASRERWIGMTVRPAGVLMIDEGASRALVERGKSLLARGITEITGTFGKGDVVVIRDQRGRELARGLINYDADEARLIMGRRSNEFEQLLGRQAYEEVIHRDNMVMSIQR
jgi:glutamate 5-kinase